MKTLAFFIACLFATVARAEILPGNYTEPANSHFTNIRIDNFAGTSLLSGLAWFRSDDGTTNIPVKISGIIAPARGTDHFHLESGVITLNYGVGSSGWQCRYPYDMVIRANGPNLVLQGFEPGGVPPRATSCPALSALEPYIWTQAYGPFKLQSPAKTKKPDAGKSQDGFCSEKTNGQACGDVKDDPFHGPSRGVCMPQPSVEQKKTKYICVYGG